MLVVSSCYVMDMLPIPEGRPRMANANPKTEIHGYVAGTWAIDPIHSDVSFSVREKGPHTGDSPGQPVQGTNCALSSFTRGILAPCQLGESTCPARATGCANRSLNMKPR